MQDALPVVVYEKIKSGEIKPESSSRKLLSRFNLVLLKSSKIRKSLKFS